MNLSRLGRGEFLAVLGGLLLALGLFLPWYATNPDNRNAEIDGVRGSVSGWEAFPILHWALLAAGDDFKRRLTKAGTYKIICTFHEEEMKMTITVKKKS